MEKYFIKHVDLINIGDGYFKIKIENHGTFDIPYYEIFLFLQEYQPKLYTYLKKFEHNYVFMFNDIVDIGVNVNTILETYVNNVVRYRIERDSKTYQSK